MRFRLSSLDMWHIQQAIDTASPSSQQTRVLAEGNGKDCSGIVPPNLPRELTISKAIILQASSFVNWCLLDIDTHCARPVWPRYLDLDT